MVSDFAWGTPNAQPVTLSFWAHSSLTGTFGGSIGNTRWHAILSIHLFASGREHLDEDRRHHSRRHGWNMGDERQRRWLCLSVSILALARIIAAPPAHGRRQIMSARPARVSIVATNGATFYITGVKLEDRQRSNAVQPPVARQEHGRLPEVLSEVPYTADRLGSSCSGQCFGGAVTFLQMRAVANYVRASPINTGVCGEAAQHYVRRIRAITPNSCLTANMTAAGVLAIATF